MTWTRTASRVWVDWMRMQLEDKRMGAAAVVRGRLLSRERAYRARRSSSPSVFPEIRSGTKPKYPPFDFDFVKRRAHTQNPKNETETKTEERGDPNHERAPKPFASNQGSIFTGYGQPLKHQSRPCCSSRFSPLLCDVAHTGLGPWTCFCLLCCTPRTQKYNFFFDSVLSTFD